MSDSFADLWASTTPQSKPQTLGAHKPAPAVNQPQRKDVFSLLASTSSPATSSSNITSGRTSRTNTPAATKPSTTNASSDAFGDLFSSATGTSASSKAPTTQMTLAARLAMEGQQKRGPNTPSPVGMSRSSTNTPTTTSTASNDAWSGLDALMGASSVTRSSSSVSQPSNALLDDDDWGLGDFGPASKPTASTVTSSATSMRPTAAPTPQKPTPTSGGTGGGSLWDLDDFAGPSASSVQPTRVPSQPQADDGWGTSFDTPDKDFDFGNREDRDASGGLLGQDNSQQDDILGMLSRPVEEVKKAHHPPASRPSPPIQAQQQNRRPSPPPHIIGQIVEMGFSVTQARQALANTPNGTDVAAALETLLNGPERGSSSPAPPQQPPRRSSPPSDPTLAPTRRGAPKGFRERERERLERQKSEAEGRSGTPLSLNEVQEQADKLLSQASAMGISALSKASAFWKGTVVKAYEERSGSSTPANNSKPKWMQEAEQHGVGDEPPTPHTAQHQGGFRDDNDGDDNEVHQQPPAPRRPPTTSPVQRLPDPEPEVDLFSSAPVPQQQSRPPPAAPAPQRRPPQTQSRPQASRPIVSSPPPLARIQRTLPNISSPSLSTVVRHKQTGTEQFKLGQYGAACEAYTLAISSIPQGHLLLVPLYTNRALARIKTGEYKGAEEDAEGALKIICGSSGSSSSSTVQDPAAEFLPSSSSSSTPSAWTWNWNPATEDLSVIEAGQSKSNQGGWSHPQGLGVDLVDSYIKAVKRRSEALEGREKWAEAGRGWEVLAGGTFGWVSESVRKEAARGAARCRSMVGGGGSSGGGANGASLGSSGPSSSSRPPAPKPKPKPVRVQPTSVSQGPSKAVQALRESNAQADAEDAMRHSLKDSVDAKLNNWKNGKETNIRALLASLDLVLWSEILEGGVKPAGLHVLVTGAQVKKGYMKAIGRVHPDKLNSSNSTVEQRMLANGVFGVLNEAWLAFQASGQ